MEHPRIEHFTRTLFEFEDTPSEPILESLLQIPR